MGTAREIEAAVQKLPPDELAEFRAWCAEFDAGEWDRQLQQGIEAGRLDALANEALLDLREGRCAER